MKRTKPKKKPTIEQFMRAQIMKIKAVVPGMNVTIVARYPMDPDAEIVFSDDNMDGVIHTLQRSGKAARLRQCHRPAGRGGSDRRLYGLPTGASRMTIQSKLDQVLALAEKATPGPWGACNQDKGGCICGGVHSVSEDMGVAGTGSIIEDLFCGNREEDADKIAANAVLIASAVNFLRELGPAIRAAVGGEAVNVAWRFVDKTGQYAYSSWADIGTPIGDHDASRIAIQYAYASPATVGVWIDTDDYEACKQLLAEIREAAGLKEKPGSILERIRELAALIGEKA